MVITKDKNAPPQLWSRAEVKCVSKNLSTVRRRFATIPRGNRFSIDVIIHAWEWKFVYYSVETRFSPLVMRMKAKDTPLHYTCCRKKRWICNERNKRKK